jgi:dipeptidyl aminopeptidase/acylaminoacyl peptidase
VKRTGTQAFAVILFAALNAWTALASGVERQLISAADFGALPFMVGPKMSPDAKHVATEAHVNGAKRLVILELGAKPGLSHSFSMPGKWELVGYRWAGNDRVLVSIGHSDVLFGDDVYVTRLVMYDLKTDKAAFIGKKNEGVEGDNIIYVDRDGHWLLLNVQKTIFDYPSVYRVDLDTMEMKKVVGEHPYVWNWFADSSGTVRAGLGVQSRRWWLLYRKDADAKFEKVMRRVLKQGDDDEGSIERFIPLNGSDHGYAVTNARTGRYGLYHYDFSSDSIGEPVFEHPQVDIDDFRMSEQNEITAVYYTDDRSRVEWLVPRMKELQGKIDRALPDRINRVISMSRDGEKMLIWSGSAADPGVYFYYDAPAAKMSQLARPYGKMTDKQLANMDSVSYAARDGLQIPAYLTLPPGVEAKQLPLIVMPHGGPFLRDEWGYDTWVQFLANRGYVVLQPNFRGSTGYGRDFVVKGEGQWGRTMQDDLDDGVKWLVEQGKVDPKRVCIMGGSYGGYAALWAAARNPEIYRCAISFAGISDLAAMIKYDRRAFAATRYYTAWRERVQGDKNFDLNTVSPLYAIDRINIPLLIAHGSDDENVPLAQSRKLHDALVKAKKPHSYIVYEGEGHGFDKPENATAFLEQVDQFLRTNNPPD